MDAPSAIPSFDRHVERQTDYIVAHALKAQLQQPLE